MDQHKWSCTQVRCRGRRYTYLGGNERNRYILHWKYFHRRRWEYSGILSQHQVTPTREYISSLFNLYSNQWKISELYLEIVNLQKKEIQRQEEEISQLNKLLEMIEEHDRILEDSYHKLYMSLEQPPTNCWIKKLWKKIIRKEM